MVCMTTARSRLSPWSAVHTDDTSITGTSPETPPCCTAADRPAAGEAGGLRMSLDAGESSELLVEVPLPRCTTAVDLACAGIDTACCSTSASSSGSLDESPGGRLYCRTGISRDVRWRCPWATNPCASSSRSNSTKPMMGPALLGSTATCTTSPCPLVSSLTSTSLIASGSTGMKMHRLGNSVVKGIVFIFFGSLPYAYTSTVPMFLTPWYTTLSVAFVCTWGFANCAHPRLPSSQTQLRSTSPNLDLSQLWTAVLEVPLGRTRNTARAASVGRCWKTVPAADTLAMTKDRGQNRGSNCLTT
mmetsp:Transcript_33012/g.79593  ORF Transcript_33012/g.79593 Transcript_33012/m.79593 type:complete len:302 (-) Transcript_33012:12-917(-)